MRLLHLRSGRVLGLLLLALAPAACADAAPEDDETADEEPVSTSEDPLTAAARGLLQREMKRMPDPAGMPRAWSQPDSDGWFDERGKCGPTATANTLRLYGKDGISPEACYEAGVSWVVGSRPVDIAGYLRRTQPQLGCRVVYPEDGPALLRAAAKTARPVMVWFRTEGLTSHWVNVVGVRGAGATEQAVLMSWGRYYTVPMRRLDEAWQSVYGFRHPAVLCSARSAYLGRPL